MLAAVRDRRLPEEPCGVTYTRYLVVVGSGSTAGFCHLTTTVPMPGVNVTLWGWPARVAWHGQALRRSVQADGC